MPKICCVSYLNARPFVKGIHKLIENNPHTANDWSLIEAPPADCVGIFERGEADVALLPVAALLGFDNEKVSILPNWCIGAQGAVLSVCIFSNVPIEKVKTLYLDAESRTSNNLSKILLKHYWKVQPQFEQHPNSLSQIKDDAAAVVIGDKAILHYNDYEYVYDLAQVWQDWQNLPFVFAVWVYNKQKLNASQLADLQSAFEWGTANLEAFAQELTGSLNLGTPAITEYLTRYIQYGFGPAQQQALDLYLKELKEL